MAMVSDIQEDKKPEEMTKEQKQTALLERIQEMQTARTNYGIENQWSYADNVMIPHEFIDTGLKSWQSKNSQMIAFTKVHTALSLIIDQNPETQIFARKKEWEPKVNLIKGVFNYSWDHGDGRQEMKKFCFDLFKRGFAAGRTYHRRDTREVDELIVYDADSNEHTYEERTIVDFDDVYWENMDVWNCWFDEQADSKKNMRDWCWRKVYDWNTFKLKFSKDKFDITEEVKPGGDTSYRKTKDTKEQKHPQSKQMIEVIFYENKETDRFQILANGILILDIPLPYKHKQLSCFFAACWQRATDTIYGVGMPELTRSNTNLLDKISNMTVDQLIISIYKMLLYGGAEEFSEEELDLEPGRAQKVFDVNNFKWLDSPSVGAEVFKVQEMIMNQIDEETGVTRSLGGRELGNTATEISINREAGLRRMKTPLDSIEDAMEEEGYLRLALIQQVYSQPERVEKVVEESVVARFFDFITQRSQSFVPQFRSIRLPLEKGANGEITPSNKDNFFEITDDDLRGEYDIKIRPMSTLPVSEELTRQRKLQLYNIIAQAPYTDAYKAEREIVKAFDEEPDDWMMSEEEIIAQQEKAAEQQQMQAQMEAMGAEPVPTEGSTPAGGAPKVIPQTETTPSQSQMMNGSMLQT